jgi:hypothetical protein
MGISGLREARNIFVPMAKVAIPMPQMAICR